jgi:serine/threonine protein kinase
LRSLPQQALEVGACPAYLMRRAAGRDLGDVDVWQQLVVSDLRDRLRVAAALTNGFRVLHSHRIVHGDIKPDNFCFDASTLVVSILDIDGGGYDPVKSVESFAPNVDSIPKYAAPETAPTNQASTPERWQEVWRQPERRREPDLWGLAVLIYSIVIDRRGPFPSELFTESYLAAFSDKEEWPHHEQRERFSELKVAPLLPHFENVFSIEKRIAAGSSRPAALHWTRFLSEAITGLDTAKTAVPTRNRTKTPHPPVRVQVPFLTGRPEAVAVSKLRTVGLRLGTKTTEVDPSAVVGHVIGQRPKPGAMVEPNTAVDIVVARAPAESLARVFFQNILMPGHFLRHRNRQSP